MRWLALLLVVVLIPACSTKGEVPAGPFFPADLDEATYPNGHPLVLHAVQSAAVAQLEQDCYTALNAYRQGLGLLPLARNVGAEALGRAYSKHMPIEPFFAHIDPEGDDVAGRVTRVGGFYVALRENLEFNSVGDATQILNAWIASPGHQANLVATDVNAIGIGVWFDGTYYYITQEFTFQ